MIVELQDQDSKQSTLSTLQRIKEINTSKDFLEQCTYFIGLTDLYQFHSTCYSNETMLYCPVLIKIIHPEIQASHNGAKYLLQVWKKGGKRVFERALQDEVSLWSISYNHFIYKPSQRDDNSDFYHVIDFTKDGNTFLVKDFAIGSQSTNNLTHPQLIAKFLAYSNNMLYLANHNQIDVAQLPALDDNSAPIYIPQQEVFSIQLENESSNKDIPCKLLAFIVHKYNDAEHPSILACIESTQTIVDFSFLNVKRSQSVNSNQKYEYQLSQFREIITSKSAQNTNDRIVKFDFIVQASTQFVIACAQRVSGNFDVYYNGFKVSTYENLVTISRFELTFDTLFIQMKTDRFEKKDKNGKIQYIYGPDLDGKERVRAIHYHWENKMNYENSEYEKHYLIKNCFFQRIKNHCKQFTSFNLLGTVLVISHGKMLSIYSILAQQWVKHFTFETDIASMFRSTIQLGQMTILLTNNQIRIVKADRRAVVPDDQELPWIEDANIKITLPPGKITTYANDLEDNKWIIFLMKDAQRKCSLIALIDNQLYDVSSQIDKFGGISLLLTLIEKTNIFFLYSVCENTEFILQYNKRIKLFEINMEEDVPEEERKRRLAAQDVVLNEDEQEEAKKKPVEQKVYPFKPVVRTKAIFKVPELKAQLKYGVKFRLHEAHKDEDEEVEKHHVEQDFLIVGDNHNLYNIDLTELKCRNVFEDQNAIGIYFSDNNYLYTLSHRSGNRSSGFRLYDIENVVERGKDYSYLLTSNVQVGCQGYIDFSPANQRIVFQASFEKLEVVPVLHRNTISYIGMRPRVQYLATRIIDGKFYALGIKGRLYAWDMITGKNLQTQAPLYSNLAEYEVYQWDKKIDQVYQKEWYNKILLKKKIPIKDYDDKEYYGHSRDHSIKGQISYIDKQPKQFYEFKLIEIVSDKEVKEHFTFVHPYYNGMMQYLYFSQDLTYMYERLKYERQFLYAREEKNGITIWHIIHRFNQVPIDLLNVTSYPFIFSPGFTKYIDIDNSHENFIIRDTLKNEVQIAAIPPQLMSAKNESIENIARKFQWLDEDTILVVNNEGLERLIDIRDKFREINFNTIPLYDPSIAQKNHYFLDRPTVAESETLERLKRKYQAYKTTYYLINKRDAKGKIVPYNLYQSLFNIDYRVNECKDRFVTDMSFTFLHWSLIEQLGSGKLTVDQIDLEQIENLFYNILPGGNTILHALHDKGDLIEKLMKIANFKDDKPEIVIHVPFLQNMEEKSPIHLCSENTEYRYINMFLECLQAYPIDHHSRAIADEYHTLVKHKLPAFIPYLESRVKQTESISSITKGMLKVTNLNHVCVASFWHSQEDIDQLLQPAPIEQDIKLSFLDVPQAHDFVSETGKKFFEELADTDDMKLFETHGVKKIIEFKWPLIFEYTVKKLFMPFLIYLGLYLVLMHWVFYLPEMSDFGYGVQIGAILFSLYFLGIEIYQVTSAGVNYFYSFWNYLDIVPPVLMIIFLYLFNTNFFIIPQETANIEASIQATISLMMWLKVLYFMRIFQTTGYLIKIIIEVIVDMKYFLFILFLTFIAFGDAMYNINTSNTEEKQFINYGGYLGGTLFVYRMVLGDFDTEQFGDVALPYMWILFLLCTILNMIIVMNLLIAIISESFARINAEKDQASYQEKASLISENLYLVPQSRCIRYCHENRYLLFAVDTEEELAEHQETIDMKLEKLKETMIVQNKKTVKKLHEVIHQNHQEMLKIVRGDNANNQVAAAHHHH